MDRSPLHIFVVDNDPFFLKLISEFLKRDGHRVSCADNVLECLDVLTGIQPDIIFIDLIMPQLGGDDLCRILRHHSHLQDTFLVIVSAVALERSVDIYALGANACIAKGPFLEMQSHIREVILDAQNPRKEYPLQQLRGGDTLYSRRITTELLQQVDHLREILQNMSQGIVEISGGRIIYVNQSFLQMLNVSSVEILGTVLSEALPPPLLEVLSKAVVSAAAGEGVLQKTAVQFSDKQFVVEELCLSRDHPGQIFVLTDITERKRMESVIEAANLTENLGYVFSGIRHEIGNPVNSLKMALSVLQRNLNEYDKDTVAEFLDRSLAEISRIEYLLKALKNYSLFESPEVQGIQVSQFLQNFITLIRSDFEKLNIQISTIIAEDRMVVRADGRALHHVLLNLLTNAADAVSQVETPRIAISSYFKEGMVVIKVDDNGKGIPKDDQQHLFKPFFTSKTTGTGLGLAIVRKMLTAMQGFITIESYQNIGTTVTVLLPGSIDDTESKESSHY